MMKILKDVTEGIEPFSLLSYQQALWDRLNQGGFKQGQMSLYSAVQYTGKSTFLKSAYYNNLCKEIVLPMKPAPKYKFSRAKWYETEYKWQDRDKVLKWCTAQFGSCPQVSDAWSRWFENDHNKIFFRDEQDYLLFLLRWV